MSSGELPAPAYERAQLTPGIAHFGLGNFHRSHQAMYIDRLLQRGGHLDWGICGIGVMPADAAMRDALAAQDYIYTLVEKSGDGSIHASRIGCICGFLHAPDDRDAVLTLLAAPTTRIVSLTITEGGYNIDRTTGEFDLRAPAIRRDVATPRQPATVFGYITEALRLRREQGVAPFIVMSCDNLPGNGLVARQAILAYAREIDPDLTGWIDANVAFPNSMVDRITPVTTDDDRALVRSLYGIEDRWPVVTEPFTQWVLEDAFCNDRPPYEDVGVQVVANVEPYELMKLRLLNGTHQAMAYIGMLRGHTYVHEAAGDAIIERFLRAYLAEARATLDPVPGIDVDEYIESLFQRFSNAAIADTLARLAVDASDRIPKFVLPTIRDIIASGKPATLGAVVIATWAHWIEIMAASGRLDEVRDPLRNELLTATQDENPAAFLALESVFGSLGTHPGFVQDYKSALHSLQSDATPNWLGLIDA